MEIPRLIGPALLTLAFYLWDAFAARRRAAPGPALDLADRPCWRRWAVIVAAWNLLLRG